MPGTELFKSVDTPAPGMQRAAKARLQRTAVEVLRAMKATRTYDELAAETGLSAGDLNRYVNGHVLPGADRARAVVDGFGPDRVAAALTDRLRIDDEGYVDTTAAVFDQPFLGLAAGVAAESAGLGRPAAVLTAATDGITFAAALAGHLGTRCVYAKKTRETAVDAFVEARARLRSGIELTYYLPERALSAGDEVVVVDDLIRSGETQELLLDIADATGAQVVGVLALVAVGEEGLDRVRGRVDAPVQALVTVGG